MDIFAKRVQTVARGFLVRRNILIPSSEIQTKNWRKTRDWYDNGKRNECELYQRSMVERITGEVCAKTDLRINIISKNMLNKKYPMKDIDGFEWTEDFDGLVLKHGDSFYFNLKMICDAGGVQTRSLREVYHFVCVQLEHLLKNPRSDIHFINILDGDTSFRNIEKFTFLLNKPQYSSVRNQVFVGDMKQFQSFWKKSDKQLQTFWKKIEQISVL